ncbi:MAG TPA: M1 family aminopeptidase [Terriglobales bacterium]
MIGTILLFEVKQRLVRISTYMYFLILFAAGYIFAITVGGGFGSASVDFGGKVFVNSPFGLAQFIPGVAMLGLIVTAALAGQATYQDIDNDCDSFFYTAPIRKIDYLAGRFLGSLLTQLIIFSGIGMGVWLGMRMPFLDEARIGPERFMSYLEPYLTLILPNLIFLTAIFFCLAALGRKMLPVYAGSALLLIGYLIVGSVLNDPTKSATYALGDPFGERAFARLTQYLTPFERNTQLMPFHGILLWNRVLWLGVSAALFVFTYFKFSRSQALTRGRKKIDEAGEEAETTAAAIPAIATVFSGRTSLGQLVSLTWLQFAETVKNVFFAVILVAGFLFAVLVGNLPTDFFSTPFYPVTSRILQLVIAGFGLFQLIIIVFYSGELVWRERDAKVSQIVDAMPAQRWVLFASKLGALMLVQVVIAVLVIAAGMTVQIMHGYFRFEFGVYLKELFLIALIQNCITCTLAILIQTVVNNKYLGYFLVVILYVGVISIALPQLGFEHYLIRFGRLPQHVYSDMNGYTPYVKALFWFELYWAIAAVFLAIVTNLFWVRGIEGGVKQRLRLGSQRLTRASRMAMAVCLILFAATGSYIFYNTNILNPYRNSKQQEAEQAQYEKKYRKYLDMPQPRITDVQTTVNFYPEQRSATVEGTMWLENKTQATIDQVALSLPTRNAKSIQVLSFNGGQTPVIQDNDLGFHVYRLNSPLAPGGRIALQFAFQFDNPGFSNSVGDTRIVQNGSFLNVGYTPYVGYRPAQELNDDSARRRNKLDKVKRMPKLEDVAARQNNYIAQDGDWINFDATISTSPDQIAIAPGYLQKEWIEGGRRYFHYKMDAPILNFFSFNSGRYQVRHDRWNDVNLEIYYQPGHEFNLDRMTDGMKATLAYCSANFSPFQFHQLRIIEFPRYADFAQSFPNTIPFSESLGFITRVDTKKPDAIDLPFYVTSHEVAHQWWGHQEVAANVEGATSLVETLAQYSALMVMKHRYGPDAMKRFLAYELRNYLILRGLERNDEAPLARVQARQGYIHYQKGGLVMYALQDYIGEDKVNHALSEFVKAFGFKGAPYATSMDLIGYLRKDTPPQYQSLIDDLFEHITLYESKAESATFTKQQDGKYRVHLVAGFKKYRADSRGEQKEVPANDWIDIGVLDAQGKYLYLEKRKIEKDKTELDLVVNQLPAQAGIDPLNKLIDRNPEDNLVKVTEAK